MTPPAIRAAAERLRGVVHRTPVATCATLDRLAGRALFFKCEHLQKAGAFKFRGASNAVLSLADDVAARGVVTHSSGNHAAALALAAQQRGIAAHVVMPRSVSAPKRRAVEEYGGRVVSCEPTMAARQAAAAALQAETGATLIPPFDHPDVIAGQGTAALELLADVPDLDAIVAPIGGGGLISGTAIAAAAHDRRIAVVAAEPAGADDAARSKAAGEWIDQTDPHTIADGLLTSLGTLTWPIVRDQVAAVVTVSEAEIVAAMRLLWERAKLLVEPSAAVALAAVLSPAFPATQRRVGIILSGGNVDLDHLPWGSDER
ncbi:MAG: pyridoxal-phosphate dependent enzyme [Deltaproteobacteria bacterium]|nr:pyridoxal-phosphate dependent enzyme [Deltaproteobacteria bacterium]